MDEMTAHTIKIDDLVELTVGEKEFPKYVRPILVLANQFAQGTRPEVVGQLTELIKECPYKTYEEWKKWYLQKKPDAIDNAVEKISKMLKNFAKTINEVIDDKMIREWVEELVLLKTFVGLKLQEPILRWLAGRERKEYRLSTREEESRGIDGWIGDKSVSIKPITYKTERGLMEKIKADRIIFYEKKTDERGRTSEIIITEV
jgi:hypothetical protein